MNEKGLGSCWEAFRGENFTTLSSLFSITSDELKELGLKMGERKNFLAGLRHLTTYSNERLRSLNVAESDMETFRIAAQECLEKVAGFFLSELIFHFLTLSEIMIPRRSLGRWWDGTKFKRGQ